MGNLCSCMIENTTMYSAYARFTSIIYVTLYVLVVFSGVATFSTLGNWAIEPSYDPHIEIAGHKLGRFTHGHNPYYGNYEKLNLKMDVDIDLSPLFNWNVRQIFVWITAEWDEHEGLHRLVTVWDRICTTPEAAKFRSKKLKLKYPIKDSVRTLRG